MNCWRVTGCLTSKGMKNEKTILDFPCMYDAHMLRVFCLECTFIWQSSLRSGGEGVPKHRPAYYQHNASSWQ